MNTIYSHARKCSTLLVGTVCTVICQVKGKKKKRTPYPLERTPGMLGNEEYVLTPLTYASVDESVGNEPINGPEVGTRCQE